MHACDVNFYRSLASLAVRSAEQVVPLLTSLLPITSVGQGAWLSICRTAGACVIGADGPYVDQPHLMIDAQRFRTADLGYPIDLERRADLVQSLEAGEHLPADRADDFIDTLTVHSPLVRSRQRFPAKGANIRSASSRQGLGPRCEQRGP